MEIHTHTHTHTELTDSLCCTPGTNNIVNQLYSKNIFKKRMYGNRNSHVLLRSAKWCYREKLWKTLIRIIRLLTFPFSVPIQVIAIFRCLWGIYTSVNCIKLMQYKWLFFTEMQIVSSWTALTVTQYILTYFASICQIFSASLMTIYLHAFWILLWTDCDTNSFLHQLIN